MTPRLALASLVALAACGAPAPDRAPAPGTVTQAAVSHDSARTIAASWPDALGGFLALANPVTGNALLFRRDTLAMPASVAVVGYDSTTWPAAIRDVRPLPCGARAILRVTGVAPGWTLAFDAARAAQARPLVIDVLEDLTASDSQRVVVRIQRALNTLPDTGSAMEFRGLPVVVRDAWLVHAPSGTFIVARAARMRNLEATAHEELRFVVLEDDQPRFVARVAGDEEAIESWDLLAALDVQGQPWLAVAREGVSSLQLEVITRDASAWRSVWRSDALSCGK
ncbi:MAG: hypothetical protein ACYC3L_12515 [Gemmatimonadaceae bacterium]